MAGAAGRDGDDVRGPLLRAPNVKLAGFKWVTPGALLAIVLWLVASAAFAFYAANFGSYDKTYGTLGGLVCLLVWMWITNVALLLGMELNSERERSRELDAGVPGAHRELQLDARSKPEAPEDHLAAGPQFFTNPSSNPKEE